jgi:hypothetical protein
LFIYGGFLEVKNRLLCAVAAMVVSSTVFAQTSSSSSVASRDSEAAGVPAAGRAGVGPPPEPAATASHRFSRIAVGTGFSPLGVQISVTTNLQEHLNLRTSGNIFGYSTSFNAGGVPADAKLSLSSAGVSLDIYPFHNGFRVSPGLLFYNGNEVTANASVPGGTSFTLNDQTYYSAKANPATGATPVSGNGSMNLHTTNPAFTITAGWGNTLPHRGHWSFPFEAGVAFVGAPSVKANLTGWACYDPALTQCTDVNSKTDPIAIEIQSDLQAQVNKWAHDMEWLKTYPIASFGVAYSFGIRNR